MRAFFHPDQSLHDPQQFMQVGVIRDPKDLPSRTEALLGALGKAQNHAGNARRLRRRAGRDHPHAGLSGLSRRRV